MTNQRCPICGASAIHGVLLREQVPVHQNLLMRDRLAAIKVPRGDLDIVACRECGFIFNRAFDLSKLEYGEKYDNAQYYSPSFNAYLDGLARLLITERNVRKCHIVEVGCGQGSFLRRLVADQSLGNVGYGFDPSYQGNLIDLDGRLRFQQTFYDEQCADVPADVIVCRHVIEHVPDPLTLLSSIRKALVHTQNARIFCETPCVEWILRNQVIWDFFYEHCSYFTATSLRTAFEIAGFEVKSVEHVFEGQYLWLEATLTPETNTQITRSPQAALRLSEEFAKWEENAISRWREKIKEMTSRGEKIALWGAGAKGVTFANLIEARTNWIDCIVDLNPQKQGCYVPGTGHPIVAPEALATRNITAAVLMNSNYREENQRLLKEAGINIRFIEKV